MVNKKYNQTCMRTDKIKLLFFPTVVQEEMSHRKKMSQGKARTRVLDNRNSQHVNGYKTADYYQL